MQRNTKQLTKAPFDLLIIGGGIYGAAMAWEATLRGLAVALVEKGDFGAATSANSLKIIHGGLRYLQHGDLRRARTSILERKRLMRLAPHLIHPLPVLIPTYGHGLKGRHAFAVGLALNNLLTLDHNWLADPQKHLPQGYTISKAATLELLPDLPQQGLTGSAIFYDAQVYNAERFVLALLHSATAAGAVVANYVAATRLIAAGDAIVGARVEDLLTGDRFDIRAEVTVDTTGPWLHKLLDNSTGQATDSRPRFAKAINLVTHSLFERHAVGLSGQEHYRDADAVVAKSGRFFFVAPWRNRAMIGTEYVRYSGEPDAAAVAEAEIRTFLDNFNQMYPSAQLQSADLSLVHLGLVPLAETDPGTGAVQLRKHHQIVDHAKTGQKGFVSVLGVKYTTARAVAEEVTTYIVQRYLAHRRTITVRPSHAATPPLHGGQITSFAQFLADKHAQHHYDMDEATLRPLVYNYGSAFPMVLRYLSSNPQMEQLTSSALLAAEVRHAIHCEMAQTLLDVVLRRTEVGTAGHPGASTLEFCAAVMAQMLGWTPHRQRQEVQTVHDHFLKLLPIGTDDATTNNRKHNFIYKNNPIANDLAEPVADTSIR